jgi:ribosome-associated protein
VRDKVKENGGQVYGLEGEDTGEWVLVDLGDMIVHIMQPAIRQYYRLEEIWGEKPVKLGAAKRKSTTEGKEAAEPKTRSKHLAANKDEPEAKPVRERKTAAAKSTATKTTAAKKPAATKVAIGKTVKVAPSKTDVAEIKAKRAAKAAVAKAAEAEPAKKVIRRVKKAAE